jgi:hypothetical protein
LHLKSYYYSLLFEKMIERYVAVVAVVIELVGIVASVGSVGGSDSDTALNALLKKRPLGAFFA